jgi:hypothetical protein
MKRTNLPLDTKHTHIGMILQYKYLNNPTYTYTIIDKPQICHGKSVVKARINETNETFFFNNWMLQDSIILTNIPS